MVETHFLGILMGPKASIYHIERYIRKVTKFGVLGSLLVGVIEIQ